MSTLSTGRRPLGSAAVLSTAVLWSDVLSSVVPVDLPTAGLSGERLESRRRHFRRPHRRSADHARAVALGLQEGGGRSLRAVPEVPS